MKLKIAVVLAIASASMVAQADLGQTVTFLNGTSGRVVAESGTTTGYVKAITINADGKQLIEPGQIFDGERIVKTAENKCYKITEKLLELKDFSVGDAKIQVPTIKHESQEVPCGQA